MFYSPVTRTWHVYKGMAQALSTEDIIGYLRRLHNKEEDNLGPNCKTRTVAESILAENTHVSPQKELAGLVQVGAVWMSRRLNVQTETGNELTWQTDLNNYTNNLNFEC